jgi:hypothetical protein
VLLQDVIEKVEEGHPGLEIPLQTRAQKIKHRSLLGRRRSRRDGMMRLPACVMSLAASSDMREDEKFGTAISTSHAKKSDAGVRSRIATLDGVRCRAKHTLSKVHLKFARRFERLPGAT